MSKNDYDINKNKTELVSYNHITKEYEEQLLVLNEYFRESECFRCLNLFLTIIIQSLENIQTEMHCFSKGLIVVGAK